MRSSISLPLTSRHVPHVDYWSSHPIYPRPSSSATRTPVPLSHPPPYPSANTPPPLKATHNSPRTWLLTSALSPLQIRLIRLLLAHGDYVVACLAPYEIDNEERSAEFRALVDECKSGRKGREGWKDRLRGVRCDGSAMGQCSAAVAEAVQFFGRVDILLCCRSEGESCRTVIPHPRKSWERKRKRWMRGRDGE